MRAYLIERTTMEWSRIASQLRGLVEQHERNGINFGDYAGGREVVAFLEDVRGMTRYDDQHAFPDQPPVELPQRVQRVETAREYVDRKGAEYAAAIRPFASKPRKRDPLDPLGIGAATAASKPKRRRWWRRG